MQGYTSQSWGPSIDPWGLGPAWSLMCMESWANPHPFIGLNFLENEWTKLPLALIFLLHSAYETVYHSLCCLENWAPGYPGLFWAPGQVLYAGTLGGG